MSQIDFMKTGRVEPTTPLIALSHVTEESYMLCYCPTQKPMRAPVSRDYISSESNHTLDSPFSCTRGSYMLCYCFTQKPMRAPVSGDQISGESDQTLGLSCAHEEVACEQALGLGVWVFVGGRGWGEGKERELAAMSHEFESLR